MIDSLESFILFLEWVFQIVLYLNDNEWKNPFLSHDFWAHTVPLLDTLSTGFLHVASLDVLECNIKKYVMGI